jgi:hypothetical protein
MAISLSIGFAQPKLCLSETLFNCSGFESLENFG